MKSLVVSDDVHARIMAQKGDRSVNVYLAGLVGAGPVVRSERRPGRPMGPDGRLYTRILTDIEGMAPGEKLKTLPGHQLMVHRAVHALNNRALRAGTCATDSSGATIYPYAYDLAAYEVHKRIGKMIQI